MSAFLPSINNLASMLPYLNNNSNDTLNRTAKRFQVTQCGSIYDILALHVCYDQPRLKFIYILKVPNSERKVEEKGKIVSFKFFKCILKTHS